MNALEKFAKDCLDPERYGHAVSFEVREAARKALGRTPMIRLNTCHNHPPSPAFVDCLIPKSEMCAGCRWGNGELSAADDQERN